MRDSPSLLEVGSLGRRQSFGQSIQALRQTRLARVQVVKLGFTCKQDKLDKVREESDTKADGQAVQADVGTRKVEAEGGGVGRHCWKVFGYWK